MKLSFKMKERDKLVATLLGTALVLGGVFYVSKLIENRDRTIESERQSEQDKTVDEQAIARIGAQTEITNTRELLYSDITFLDLPIYPEAWVERYFTISEQVNQLVSGEAADPDGDGLTNKEEYFYGSDPKNPVSLCISVSETCNKPNDKEAVDNDISPLTGFELFVPNRFSIKKQDFAIINRIEDSFETAAREGVDFPTLYQLSRGINLIDEVNAIDILIAEDSRDSLLNYINIRVDVLEQYSEENELTNFIEVYETSDIEELNAIKNRYIELEQNLQGEFTPERYAQSHRAFILLFKKFQDLIDIRISGLEAETINLEDFRKVSKDKAVELMWSYRFVAELEEALKDQDQALLNEIEESE